MWRRAAEQREDGVSLATDPQSRGCLHEQALQEMIERRIGGARWPPTNAMQMPTTSPRRACLRRMGRRSSSGGLNSIQPEHLSALVASHAERDAHMRFDGDAYGSRWKRATLRGTAPGSAQSGEPLRICPARLGGVPSETQDSCFPPAALR